MKTHSQNKIRCLTSYLIGFRLLAEALDEPMQTVANAEHLPITELYHIAFPCDDVPSHHHHERAEEVENGGKQNGIDNDIGCGVLHLNIRHGVTFFLFYSCPFGHY